MARARLAGYEYELLVSAPSLVAGSRVRTALPAALLALALAAPPARADAPDGRLATLDAMRAELARAMDRLRLQGFEAPYFASYQVTEVSRNEVGGRYGAVFEDRARRDRTLAVDVRVGGYALDSSGPEENTIVLGGGGEGPGWSAPREAPLDDDFGALRAALWLATDERYKEALASWFKRRSRAVYREERDRAPSFSREPPVRHVDPPAPFPFDRARWKEVVREVTALFRAHPELFEASLRVTAERQVRWLASSEGTGLVTERTVYAAHLHAASHWHHPTPGGIFESPRLQLQPVREARQASRHPGGGPEGGNRGGRSLVSLLTCVEAAAVSAPS